MKGGKKIRNWSTPYRFFYQPKTALVTRSADIGYLAYSLRNVRVQLLNQLLVNIKYVLCSVRVTESPVTVCKCLNLLKGGGGFTLIIL